MRARPLSRAGRYSELNVGITPAEALMAERGQLEGFWRSRLGKDPVARVGTALWGGASALRRAIDRTPDDALSYWRPGRLGWLARLSVSILAPNLASDPRSRDELVSYWTAIGTDGRQRVVSALSKGGHPDADVSSDVRKIGQDLARAHVAAVQSDRRNRVGELPGVLSRDQIRAYHHRVFAAHGLPRSTYGGTPVGWLPDRLQLELAGAVYAHDADLKG